MLLVQLSVDLLAAANRNCGISLAHVLGLAATTRIMPILRILDKFIQGLYKTRKITTLDEEIRFAEKIFYRTPVVLVEGAEIIVTMRYHWNSHGHRLGNYLTAAIRVGVSNHISGRQNVEKILAPAQAANSISHVLVHNFVKKWHLLVRNANGQKVCVLMFGQYFDNRFPEGCILKFWMPSRAQQNTRFFRHPQCSTTESVNLFALRPVEKNWHPRTIDRAIHQRVPGPGNAPVKCGWSKLWRRTLDEPDLNRRGFKRCDEILAEVRQGGGRHHDVWTEFMNFTRQPEKTFYFVIAVGCGLHGATQ